MNLAILSLKSKLKEAENMVMFANNGKKVKTNAYRYWKEQSRIIAESISVLEKHWFYNACENYYKSEFIKHDKSHV